MNEKLKLMTIKTCKLIVAKPLNIVILSELSKNGPMTKYVDVYPDVPKKLIKDKGIKAGYMSKRSMNEMINYCEEFTALIKKKLEE